MHYRLAEAGETHLYLGAFDQPARFRAHKHTFYDEHIEGYEMADNLPRYDAEFADPIAWGERPTRNVLFDAPADPALATQAAALANRWSRGGVRAYSPADIASAQDPILWVVSIDSDADTLEAQVRAFLDDVAPML